MDTDDRSFAAYALPELETRQGPTSTLQAMPPQDGYSRQNGTARPERAVEAARTLTAMVQDLVRQLEEQEARRRELQERVHSLEGATKAYVALRDQLRGTAGESISHDDLENLQRVLHALSQDPNHIMVLANVAQQADKLLAVVQGYMRIHQTLKS